MKKQINKRILIAGGVIILLAGAFIYFNIYNKPHIDVSAATPDLSMEAGVLLGEFLNNETEANSKYLEQIIQVSGTIAEIDTDKNDNSIITLRKNDDIESVICHVLPEENKKASNLKIGQKINIKGICTGYLMDVILVKCVIIN
ncbi:hypothetical protein [uncultured Aquimarina sp.]|uniref:OB-fold protein n=1 Tax=uncultured Aquimarina sp. TaxID=575652 RepID=UPI0026026BFA|nr:hypothetical protein [uncultured Aquimarina sp.]